MWILIIHISLSHVRAINNHLLEGLGPHVAMTAIGNPLLKWRCYVSKWSINGWISSKPPLITGWKICIWYAYYFVSQAPLIMIPDAYFRHLRIRLQGIIQKHHVLKPLTYTDQPEMLPNFSPSHGQPIPLTALTWSCLVQVTGLIPLAKHPQVQPISNLWSALPQTPAFT
jgi:hypothetical protein